MSAKQQKKKDRRPSNMLEVYMTALDGDTHDPFLDEINMGTGNYNKSEYWQQVRAFRAGMYAEAAVSREVLERAVDETKEAIVDAIYDTPGSSLLEHVTYPEPGEDQGRDDYYEQHVDEIWDGLGTESMSPSRHQAVLVDEVTGIGMEWTPPHMRMIKFRHKTSQSKGARALDNLFDRVKEFVGDGPAEEFEA